MYNRYKKLFLVLGWNSQSIGLNRHGQYESGAGMAGKCGHLQTAMKSLISVTTAV